MVVRSRWLAAAVAAVVAVGGTGALALGGRDDLQEATSFGEGDGLNRFVLTLSPEGVVSSARGDALPEPDAVAAHEAAGRSVLDVAQLAHAQEVLGKGGQLVKVGEEAYYVSELGGMAVSVGSSRDVVPLDVLRERLGLEAAPSPAPAPVEAPASAPSEGTAAPGGDLAPVSPVEAPSSVSDEQLAALSAHPEVVSVQRLDGARVLVAGSLSFDEAKALDGVTDVEVSVSVPVLGAVPNDPYFGQYGWNLENTGVNAYQQVAKSDADVDALAAWDASQGQSTVVAVIDTGFDSDHPDLAASLWTNPDEVCGSPLDNDGNGFAGDCHGWNWYANSAAVDNGTYGTHGASVAGVVGAQVNNGHGSAGVAPQTKLMPLVIGGGSSVDVNLGAQAIRYAVDNGADVINASWGGAFSGAPLDALRSAVAYAASKDVLVVAAAGNDAMDRDTSILYPASLTDANVFTVGSTTAEDTISASSAYGAQNVDVFAPGNKVATTWNDGSYRMVSGTSIAAPHVAAAVALYRSIRPGASALELKQEIMDDSQKLSVLSGKSVSGGRLSFESLSPSGSSDVSYTFSSMVAEVGAVAPQVVVSSGSGAGAYSVAVSLAMEFEGEVWALSGEPVTVGGVTRSTDDTGAVVFDLGSRAPFGSAVLSPRLELEEGNYGLVVQLLKDGAPISRPYAAPLVVGPVGSAPEGPGGGSTPAPTSPAPGGGGGSAPAPTSPSPTSPAPTSPAPGDGGGSTPSPTSPAPTTPPGGSTPSPGDGAEPEPPHVDPVDPVDGGGGGGSTPSPTSPAPGGGGGGSTPSPTSPAPTSPAPGDGGSTPSPTSPAPTSPAPTSPAPGGSAPGEGGEKEYPRVGDFRVTSVSPTRVSTAGGTLVTITGEALPDSPAVRVGTTAAGTVVSASSTSVTFRTPARIAGVYDVFVFAPDGRASQLASALEYFVEGGSSPTSPAPGGGGGSTPTPSPTSPAPTTPPGGSGPGEGAGPSVPSTPSKVGPRGERLVRNEAFVSLGSLWGLDCSSSCSGMQV